MIKEIKYLFYLAVLSIFIFLVINYYFSDYYEKKSNRKISNFLDNFNSKNIDLPIIKSDTKNIIEYKINSDQMINTKQRKFWDLINEK
jgi:hypothetical protein|tara:strand:- start:1077 stop:1340 length:264 start_codon:yes stop_codon:yes gene_type:complete